MIFARLFQFCCCAALLAAPVACSAGPSADAAVDDSEVNSATKAPIGTFVGTQKNEVGDYEVTTRMLLALENDKTYHLRITLTCTPTPCPEFVDIGTLAEDGVYELSKQAGSSKRHMRFIDSQVLTQDYTYTFDGKELKATGDVDQTEDSLFLSNETWCDAVSDCTTQNLKGTGWKCTANVCTKETAPAASATGTSGR